MAHNALQASEPLMLHMCLHILTRMCLLVLKLHMLLCVLTCADASLGTLASQLTATAQLLASATLIRSQSIFRLFIRIAKSEEKQVRQCSSTGISPNGSVP